MRYVCVHGHFYQPPRVDPGTGIMPRELSATPFHDWNERIASECYAPNAEARILDADSGETARVINNYAWISFNFGPTLLAWMETEAPDVYASLQAADRESAARWGHGNAVAQAFHHAILPLCTPRDRETEVRWGIADFEARFGRRPEGMWLPECAVDTPTLETLAAEGVAFTILAPRQARAVRAPGHDWSFVSEDELDTRRPYRIDLPSGRSIAAFFYDGAASQRIAFDRLLDDGTRLARALESMGAAENGEALLSHVATDGESYGHHHRFGEMALAFAIRSLDERSGVELTNYATFLAAHPPTWTARVHEPSSWSCAHGVERWQSDCGCALGPSNPGDQAWRSPLRDALEWLRDELHGYYQEFVGRFVSAPWELRDRYHAARMQRPDGADALLDSLALTPLDDETRADLRAALEMERLALTMFTSCGWFFDHPSDIGTQQDMKAAIAAAHRYEELSGRRVLETLLSRLSGIETVEDLALPRDAKGA